MNVPADERPAAPAVPPVGVESEVPPGDDEELVWTTLARWRAARRRFALLTVVETRGSAPRKAGTHLLLAADGESVGTLGGGAIEFESLRQAREVLASGRARFFHRHLGRDLAMCCGGEMSVFIEAVEPKPRLFVFGAGTIGRPLVALAQSCGFELTVVDARADQARPERFPGAVVLCRDPEEAARELPIGPDDHACVVTHDHALDARVAGILVRRPLAFLGMVGSRAKRGAFIGRLRADGATDEELARLRTPVGLDIGAQTPEEIAVSVVAQLIAARRGVPVEAGWERPAGGREEEGS